MDVRIAVAGVTGEDSGDTALWEAGLGEELAEVDEVVLLSGELPLGAKGIGAVGALVARIPAGCAGDLIKLLQAWAGRTGRTVEASIGGDTIKITGASREQQDKVIEAWVVNHTPRA
jgi:hypothetical protein